MKRTKTNDINADSDGRTVKVGAVVIDDEGEVGIVTHVSGGHMLFAPFDPDAEERLSWPCRQVRVLRDSVLEMDAITPRASTDDERLSPVGAELLRVFTDLASVEDRVASAIEVADAELKQVLQQVQNALTGDGKAAILGLLDRYLIENDSRFADAILQAQRQEVASAPAGE